jgi:hypothetical protein
MKCQECDMPRQARLHDDPRDPPLDDGACLCDACYETALDEEIEAADERAADLRRRKAQHIALVTA